MEQRRQRQNMQEARQLTADDFVFEQQDLPKIDA